jgi:hypothetical protein
MDAENPTRPNDFSDTPSGETASFTLSHNLYWNGAEPIPSDSNELINYTDDAHRKIGDPLLALQTGMILPRWQENIHQFADGSTTILQVFVRLANRYGAIRRQSHAVEAADPQNASSEDILGRPRPAGTAPDIGAFEFRGGIITPELFLLYFNF